MSLIIQFLKKPIITVTLLLIVIGGFATYQYTKPSDPLEGIEVYEAMIKDLTEEVSITGTVKSASEVNLAFTKSGKVARVNAKVGQNVSAGQTLIALDQKDASAAIAQADASVQLAQANYEKVLNGTSGPEVNVAQVALDNANKAYDNTVQQQETLVKNAYAAMLNSTPQAIASNTSTTATVTVSGSYTGKDQGTYNISMYDTGNGPYYSVSGLGNFSGQVNRGLPQPIGNGLYITFGSDGTLYSFTTWVIQIPNTQASNYLTNYNAYQAALETQVQTIASAKAAVDSAQASLDQKKSPPRPEDVKAAQASLAQAQAQLQTAQASYSNNIITSPISGVVVDVKAKLGEIISSNTPVVSVISDANFQIEARIPEADIAKVNVGDIANVTLDAYSGEHFSVQVVSLNPAETILEGVATYKVIFEFIQDDKRLKSGMTANIDITTNEKIGVVALPQRAIISRKGNKFVKILDGENIAERQITTGIRGIDGNVEIITGISAGEKVFVNTKEE